MEQHSIPSTSTLATWLADRQHLQRASLENFSSKEQNLLENGTTFDSKYLYSNKLARRRQHLQRAFLENFSSKEQNLLENGTTFDSKYLYSSKLARR
jgi:hypothetical protein